MGQRLAGEVVVDKGGLRADTPEPPPQQDKAVRVLVVEGDNVAALDVELGAQVVAVAQDGVVELGVGEGGAVKEQQRLVGVGFAGGVRLEGVEEVEAVLPAAVGHAGDAAEDAAKHDGVVPEGGSGIDVGGGADGRGQDDAEGEGCVMRSAVLVTRKKGVAFWKKVGKIEVAYMTWWRQKSTDQKGDLASERLVNK